MKQFDMEKLEKAITYVERMADGRIPYSNKPYEGDVLNDPNVIRCMFFIDEVLREVRANRGIVGGKRHKTSLASAFPFEVLQNFEYREDLQISYVLRQFVQLTGDPETPIINARNLNKWLGLNGYLTRKKLTPDGKENWTPTDKGYALGIMDEEIREPGREYIRLVYNRNAQEFLAANLQRITEESLENKDER